ncbi:hypothetical protein RHECNPAF_900021 [Rhizobium etli CNPAF512]|nr:hypothetical protein RHECNPAF_900021 [Rhizobium etli CNPAF512]
MLAASSDVVLSMESPYLRGHETAAPYCIIPQIEIDLGIKLSGSSGPYGALVHQKGRVSLRPMTLIAKAAFVEGPSAEPMESPTQKKAAHEPPFEFRQGRLNVPCWRRPSASSGRSAP